MKLRYAFLALIATVAIAGCKKDDTQKPDDNGNNTNTAELTAPVLSADKATLALEEASAASAALKLDWTTAGEGASYKLYANLGSRDLFTTPVEVNAGTALTHTFTHGELNEILTGFGADGETEIQFGVYASATDMESVLSNVVKVKITPYEEKFQMPAAIYVIGTATPYAWDLTEALEIKPASEGVYSANDLPMRVLPLSNNQSIKFAFSRDGSDPRFAGQAPGAAFGDIVVVETGQGYEFFPATANYTNGLYDITVNFNTMKFSMQRTGDLPEDKLPDTLYMLGGCFEWSWEFTGTTLDKVSGKTYKAEGINMRFGDGSNGFKVFLGVNQWSPYFAMADDATNGNVKIQKVEDTDIPQFYPGKIGYTDGVYDITMDFDAMIATFDRKGDIPATEPELLYLHGGCFNPAWDFSDDLTLSRTAKGIYEGDITIIEANSWDGFKIWTDKNWSFWYGMDADSTHDNIMVVDGEAYKTATGAADAQFYPVTLGYNPGTYHFNLNLNTMRLTMTAK